MFVFEGLTFDSTDSWAQSSESQQLLITICLKVLTSTLTVTVDILRTWMSEKFYLYLWLSVKTRPRSFTTPQVLQNWQTTVMSACVILLITRVVGKLCQAWWQIYLVMGATNLLLFRLLFLLSLILFLLLRLLVPYGVGVSSFCQFPPVQPVFTYSPHFDLCFTTFLTNSPNHIIPCNEGGFFLLFLPLALHGPA